MRALVLRHVPQADEPPAEKESLILPTLFGEGYGTYTIKRETFLLSFLLHTLLAILIFTSGTYIVEHRQQIHRQITG